MNIKIKISLLLIVLIFLSCTESSRQSREARINYDSLASSIPKTDTLTFLNYEISDTNSEYRYVIACNYPAMIHFDKELIQKKINYSILGKVNDIIDLFKLDQEYLLSDTNDNILKKDLNSPDGGNSYLFIDYEVINNSRSLMSMIFNVQQYTAYAAHPISYHRTLNYDMNSGAEIYLSNYSEVLDDSLFLENISNKSFEKVHKLEISDSVWIRNGTLPIWENFKNYNIKPDSIVITFDVYQVAPYAVGPVRVSIGWDELLNKPINEDINSK